VDVLHLCLLWRWPPQPPAPAPQAMTSRVLERSCRPDGIGPRLGTAGAERRFLCTGQTAAAIRIGDKTYAKGLGHAPGWIEVDLQGLYDRFEAEVGVQAGRVNRAALCFKSLSTGHAVPKRRDADARPGC